ALDDVRPVALLRARQRRALRRARSAAVGRKVRHVVVGERVRLRLFRREHQAGLLRRTEDALPGERLLVYPVTLELRLQRPAAPERDRPVDRLLDLRRVRGDELEDLLARLVAQDGDVVLVRELPFLVVRPLERIRPLAGVPLLRVLP